MAFYLSNKIVGEVETKAIQLTIEYDPQPMFNPGNYSSVDKEVLKLADKKLIMMQKKAWIAWYAEKLQKHS